MPVLPDYNTLFIHIPKNAGRSIETALLPRGVASSSGRRSRLNRAAHLMQSLTGNPTAPAFLVGTRDVSLSAQHLTLAEIRLLGLLAGETLDAMFKFCIVRNPFARAISSILHFRRRLAHLYHLDAVPTPAQVERALEIWCELEPDDHNLRAHRRPQADFVFDRETPNAMDMVLRHERLSADFVTLRRRIGATGATLPWIGKSRLAHDGYAALYTHRARRIVTRAYGADLDLFGYGFPAEAG